MDEGWRDVRRNAKDSVFVKFFEDRANVFRLYQELHPEDSESSEEDVRVRTLRRVIAKGYANDLGFSVGGRIICLVEAQSYSMEAIRLRTLFYQATTFQEYLSENGMTLEEVLRLRRGRHRRSSALSAQLFFLLYKCITIYPHATSFHESNRGA